MIEKRASIWSQSFNGYWRVIPINCQINSCNELIMGAGLAKQAKERYPFLPVIFGQQINSSDLTRDGLIFYFGPTQANLIGFPTKTHWKQPTNLFLIESGLKALKQWADLRLVYDEKIVCPRLGCGLGKLDWVSQVKPLIEEYFDDNDNFIIASL